MSQQESKMVTVGNVRIRLCDDDGTHRLHHVWIANFRREDDNEWDFSMPTAASLDVHDGTLGNLASCIDKYLKEING